MWAHIGSIETSSPVSDPVRDARLVAGAGFKPSVTELMTDWEIAEGTGEFNLPVGYVRRTPGKMKRYEINTTT